MGKVLANEVWLLIQEMSRFCSVSRCLNTAGGQGWYAGRKKGFSGIKHPQERMRPWDRGTALLDAQAGKIN